VLKLKEIRQYIAGLGIAADDHVYIGKLDNKQQKSIGVYRRSTNGSPAMAIGGAECTTYGTKPVSLLIHWNKNPSETEEAAEQLFEKLQETTGLTIGNTRINFIQLMVPEPQDLGTDENGVYEYVIWLDFIFERKR